MGEMVIETLETLKDRREMSKKKYEQWLQKVHRVRVASDIGLSNKEIAQVLPVEMVSDLLGVSQEDRAWLELRRWF